MTYFPLFNKPHATEFHNHGIGKTQLCEIKYFPQRAKHMYSCFNHGLNMTEYNQAHAFTGFFSE